MNKRTLMESLSFIDEGLIDETIKTRKAARTSHVLKVSALAASFMVLAAGAFLMLRPYLSMGKATEKSVADVVEYKAVTEESADMKTFDSDDDVYISDPGEAAPETDESAAECSANDSVDAADMDKKATIKQVPLFVYEGRNYREYHMGYSKGDMGLLRDKHIGTVSLSDDIGSGEFGELEGNTMGELYTVKDMSEDKMLMLGDTLFISDLDPSTGNDILNGLFNMSDNLYEITYMDFEDWNNGGGTNWVYDDRDGNVQDLLEEIEKAKFVPIEEVQEKEGSYMIGEKEICFMYPELKNGLIINMRLMDGGYGVFDNLPNMILKVDSDTFNRVINDFSINRNSSVKTYS